MKINNSIQESYCSFEVSKLLKEKGFEVPVINYWQTNIEGKWNYFELSNFNHALYNFNGDGDKYISNPIHALAIEWIRVNFDIHLSIDVGINGFYAHYKISPIGNIHSNVKQGWVNDESNPYSTPKEATEAGLLYILTNLI